jgi:hypothetical protein
VRRYSTRGDEREQQAIAVRTRLACEDWVSYFDAIQLDRERWLTSVEVHERWAGGARPDARRPLRSIGYDAATDELQISVGGGEPRAPSLRYFVCSPRTITVEEFEHTRAVFVDDASGARTLIRLFDLPAPGTAIANGFTRASDGPPRTRDACDARH